MSTYDLNGPGIEREVHAMSIVRALAMAGAEVVLDERGRLGAEEIVIAIERLGRELDGMRADLAESKAYALHRERALEPLMAKLAEHQARRRELEQKITDLSAELERIPR